MQKLIHIPKVDQRDRYLNIGKIQTCLEDGWKVVSVNGDGQGTFLVVLEKD